MSEESKRSRRQCTPEQKAAILQRHLIDKVPVSNLCNEYQLQPSLFYQWQWQMFENLAGVSRRLPAPGHPSERSNSLRWSITWKPSSPERTPSSQRSRGSMSN